MAHAVGLVSVLPEETKVLNVRAPVGPALTPHFYYQKGTVLAAYQFLPLPDSSPFFNALPVPRYDDMPSYNAGILRLYAQPFDKALPNPTPVCTGTRSN